MDGNSLGCGPTADDRDPALPSSRDRAPGYSDSAQAVTSHADEVRVLAVGLIRSLNAPEVHPNDTDTDLWLRYGDAAVPLARALHDVIRAEVARSRE